MSSAYVERSHLLLFLIYENDVIISFLIFYTLTYVHKDHTHSTAFPKSFPRHTL